MGKKKKSIVVGEKIPENLGPHVVVDLHCDYSKIALHFFAINAGYFDATDGHTIYGAIEKIVEGAIQKEKLPEFFGWGDVSRISWERGLGDYDKISIAMYPNRPIKKDDYRSDDEGKRYLAQLHGEKIREVLKILESNNIGYNLRVNS